jgi:hypothetical protein
MAGKSGKTISFLFAGRYGLMTGSGADRDSHDPRSAAFAHPGGSLMNSTLRNAMIGVAAASMLAVSVPAPAHATHKIGHFAAGVGLGLLIAGGIAANAAQGGYKPVYQPAYQPVYVPTCHYVTKYRWEWDPYFGSNVQKPYTVKVCN